MDGSDWETLGLRQGASVESIKRAFRRQVKSCHPDVCPDDAAAAARFKALVGAYQRVLDAAASRERSERLFARWQPARAELHPCPAGASVSRACGWRKAFHARLERAAQTAFLLVLLAAPVATVVIGAVAAGPPVVEGMAGIMPRVAALFEPAEEHQQVVLVRTADGEYLFVRSSH